MKKSRLSEKASRIPDISQPHILQTIKGYVEQVSQQTTESAKAQRFLILLKDLFGDVEAGFIEDYLQGVEKYVSVRRKDILLRGRIDALYGNLIIEFERDLRKKLGDAQRQLKHYLSCLLESGDQAYYLGLATDGILFYVYSPRLRSGGEVLLEEVEKIDFSKAAPYQAYFCLDRYFFRKTILHPGTEEIVKDFGVRSPAFRYCFDVLERAWAAVKERSDYSVIYENWAKYLRVTYGSLIGSDDLFLRHSYLAIFTKLLVWTWLSGRDSAPAPETIIAVLDGDFFIEQGIDNFLEEDFFSWIARDKTKEAGLDVSVRLINQLVSYNIRELSEDILKSLYQELVDPETRHDLGEYYTPDWLAQKMVVRMLEENPHASVLDPACGSGTFLYTAIRCKKETLGSVQETLEHVMGSVVGIDIHPLAVITAKTNYLLALGDLIRKRASNRIQIPVYVADSINPPAESMEISLYAPVPSHTTKMAEKDVSIPDSIITEPETYDAVIESTKEFARHFAGNADVSLDVYESYMRQHVPQVKDRDTLSMLFDTALVMRELVEQQRDSIWGFVLKNIYKPLFLKGRFDIVIGNPPWLSYRYVDKGEYQKLLKTMIVDDYKLLSGVSTGKKMKVKAGLITHMELATLFFLRTADLYLKEGGTIGFVMPRSLFTGDQHNTFRRQQYAMTLGFTEIWDMEKVKPLFNVPTCVFFAAKGSLVSPPYKALFVSGSLEKKNANLMDALKTMKVEEGSLYLCAKGERSFLCPSEEGLIVEQRSPYHARFRQGATIVPRNFWFVDIKPHSMFGIDPATPQVETAAAADEAAKEPYKGIILRGKVESEFLYATLLSTDIIPFGHLDFRVVVLPLLHEGDAFVLINEQKAAKLGHINLAKWLHKAQRSWEEKRGEKAEVMDVYERLDRVRGLSSQTAGRRYKILYPAAGRHMCSCVIEARTLKKTILEQELTLQGFIVDHKAYVCNSDDRNEALYLCAVLNSPTVDDAIKPLQSRRLFGPRDIHKKVWELPIPQFDPGNSLHLRLSELGERCTQRVSEMIEQGMPKKSIGSLREMVKGELQTEIGEIDGIVRQIL